MKELAEDFEILIIAWLKSDDENATNLAYSLAKKATTLQLLQTDVVGSKRFKEQDLLRAYQAGAIEQQSINIDTLDFEKLKELTKDSEKWYERYTE